jgi:hypothetical protein
MLLSLSLYVLLSLHVQLTRWGAVLRLVACVGLLFFFLGLSALGGIGLLVITLPLNNVSATSQCVDSNACMYTAYISKCNSVYLTLCKVYIADMRTDQSMPDCEM